MVTYHLFAAATLNTILFRRVFDLLSVQLSSIAGGTHTVANRLHFSQLVQKVSEDQKSHLESSRFEWSRTLFGKEQTDLRFEALSILLNAKNLGVSSQASWPQPIPVLLYFCWHCYFSMENPRSTFCTCMKLGLHAELLVDQLLFVTLWFFKQMLFLCH